MSVLVKKLASRFRASQDGSVVVEFALISTVLIALFAATIDFSFMVGAKRDAERASTLIVRAMSSCPYQASPVAATWRGTDCVTNTLRMVNDRLTNVVVNIPKATLQSAAIQRINGAIVMCPGVSNYVPSSVSTNVMSVLSKDDDVGMFAVIEIGYTPFFPITMANYGITGSLTYSQPTIDLWGNGTSFACAKT